MNFLIAYIVTAVVFLAIDFVWLAYIATNMFQTSLGHLLAEKPNLLIAAGFYIFYCVGIVFFAVMPALDKGQWVTAALYGGLFGLMAYGTYEMTNLATLRDWPVKTAIIDMVWGMGLTGLSATAGYFAVTFFSK
ncbi:MAG: DUF2177 family protein [Pseudomonadota bacterium]